MIFFIYFLIHVFIWEVLESKSFLFFFRDHLWSTFGDHLRPRIICGPFWGSFVASRSFAVGDHLRYSLPGWLSCHFVAFYLCKASQPSSCNQEGVNGVNRLTTMGEKYYWLPTKREKITDYRQEKILTDHRHGRKLSFFRKKSIFLGSKQRYRWFYKCYCKEKGKTPNISCFDGRHKSQIEGIEIVCRAYENFHKATHHSVLHITCEKCLD